MQADKVDIQIQRQLKQPVFEAVYADTWDAIAAHCPHENAGFDPVVADITLGAWMPHQVAAEFYKQLGIAFPENIYGNMLNINTAASGNFLSYSEMIGKGIDGEAIGDITVLMSYKMAACLMLHLMTIKPVVLILLMPLYNNQWGKENKWFLKFLGDAIEQTPHRLLFVAAAGKECDSPEEWKLLWKNEASALHPHNYQTAIWHHLPGVLNHEITMGLEVDPAQIIRLRNDCFIPAGIVRPDPATTPTATFEKLSLAVGSDHIHKAYLIYKSSNFFMDAQLLSGMAWKCFSQASTDLATRYMERAFFCESNALQRSILNCQYLGMLIATMQFAKVAEAPQPGKAAPPSIRSFLLEAKGWGYVMVNQPDKAYQLFLEAKAILESTAMNNAGELLYLKNILALCKLRMGKIEEAISDELQIFDAIESLAEMDYRLRYVNAINLSRLFKRQDDIGRSLLYCKIAFDTTYGNRAFGDLIFTNLNIANTLRKVDPDATQHHYVLAAIHWLACDIPEALNNRIYYAVCGDTPNSDQLVREEFLSRCLYHKIISGLAKDYAEENQPHNIPNFITIEAYSEANGYDALNASFTTYGGVFFSDGQTAKNINGKWYGHLAALVATLLFEEIDIALPGIVIIDTQNGAELPADLDELLVRAMKYQVQNIYTSTGLYVADAQRPIALFSGLTVTLSSAVSKVIRRDDKLQVYFKRYHTSCCIAEKDERFGILNKVFSAPDFAVPYSAFPQEIFPVVTRLEEQNIIQIKPTTGSCLKDGIRLHSKQSLLTR